mmetsp:Transcript_13439/g.48894  ORF Transcript_13439/g.48894 Transcript_13439/m.48894 type:complete len:1013 (-) Transcript_13439:1026-4064(-)
MSLSGIQARAQPLPTFNVCGDGALQCRLVGGACPRSAVVASVRPQGRRETYRFQHQDRWNCASTLGPGRPWLRVQASAGNSVLGSLAATALRRDEAAGVAATVGGDAAEPRARQDKSNFDVQTALRAGHDTAGVYGNPVGRKQVGRRPLEWLRRGVEEAAIEFIEEANAFDDAQWEDAVRDRELPWNFVLYTRVERHLDFEIFPEGDEEKCRFLACHLPTIWDVFSRMVQEKLVQEYGEKEWRRTRVARALKLLPKSTSHVLGTRTRSAQQKQREKLRLLRKSIEVYTDRALDLLLMERQEQAIRNTDSSLTYEQFRELSALPKPDQLPNSALQSIVYDGLRVQSIASDVSSQCQTLVLVSRSDDGSNLPLTLSNPGKAGSVKPLCEGDEVLLQTVTPNTEGAVISAKVYGTVVEVGESTIHIEMNKELVRSLQEEGGSMLSLSFNLQRLSNDPTYLRSVEALIDLKRVAKKGDKPCTAVVESFFSGGSNIVPDRLVKTQAQREKARQESPAPVLPKPAARGPKELRHTRVSVQPTGTDDSRLKTMPLALASRLKRMNAEQKEAVYFSLDEGNPVSVIQGPPGTGKTSVLDLIVRWACHKGLKVLVTAPSNAAIDNIVEKLNSKSPRDEELNVVRVGVTERIANEAQNVSLEALVADKIEALGSEGRAARKILQEAISKTKKKDEKVKMRRQMSKIGRELRRREMHLKVDVLREADVVCGTNVSSGDPLLRELPPFDLVIIDESGQATEPSSWIPLLLGRRAVLAGDVQQLPPTIISADAVAQGLAVSLMERATMIGEGSFVKKLVTQYRMHAVINYWTAAEMYGGQLYPAPFVADRVLCSSDHVKSTPITKAPMMLIDTAFLQGCGEEVDTYTGTSLMNRGEAQQVARHVEALLQAGVRGKDIAVQSPYMGQVRLIQEFLRQVKGARDIDVATVDSFQGRESDAVIISMVRSNKNRTLGFVTDRRRTNVAVTRARMHVAVIGDSLTLQGNDFLYRLLYTCRSAGSGLSEGD